jgi:hypothetical protein
VSTVTRMTRVKRVATATHVRFPVSVPGKATMRRGRHEGG